MYQAFLVEKSEGIFLSFRLEAKGKFFWRYLAPKYYKILSCHFQERKKRKNWRFSFV